MYVQVEPGEREDGFVYHVNDGWQYHINTTKGMRIYYQCVKMRTHGCPGRASSSIFGDDFHHTTSHFDYHDADHLYPLELRLRRCILDAAADSTWTAPSAMVRVEGRRFPLEVAARVYISKIRSSIYRIRIKHFPPIPLDLHEMGECLQDPTYRYITGTLDGTDNIFAGASGDMNEGAKCLIFVSQRMKEYLPQVKTVFSDGTFRTRTIHPYSIQIFNIVTVRRFHIIPLIRIIMQKRTIAAYTVALESLRALIPEFRPRKVMTDYEPAMQKAWRRVYRALLDGCLYHFSDAVCRKFVRLGLVDFLWESEVAESIVRSLLALPLLPQELIERGLLSLGREALRDGVMNELGPLFEYMDTTWIAGGKLLSVCGSIHRSNNACESDNRSLSKEVGLSHSNVWHLIGAFVRCENNSHVDLLTLVMGQTPSRKRKVSALCNDTGIKNLTSDWGRGEISVRHFLHCASRAVQNVFERRMGNTEEVEEEEPDEESDIETEESGDEVDHD